MVTINYKITIFHFSINLTHYEKIKNDWFKNRWKKLFTLFLYIRKRRLCYFKWFRIWTIWLLFVVVSQWVNIPHISNYHQWFFLSNFGLTENPTFAVSINISRTNYTAVFINKTFYLCDVWVFTIIIILWIWVGFNNTLEYPYKTRKNCVLPILNLTNQQWTVLKY